MSTRIRIATGVILTVVLLSLGFATLNEAPQLGAVLLAFAALRGSLVARQVWLEYSESRGPSSES
jgi:hypothetical protein